MTVPVKLVRDRLGEPRPGEAILPANSITGKKMALVLKLHEEAQEIAAAMDDPTEYADLLEVLIELARLNGVSAKEIEEAREDKLERLGGFRMGMVLQPARE